VMQESQLSDAQCVQKFLSIDGDKVTIPELAQFWKSLSIAERQEFGQYARAHIPPM